MMMTLLRSSVPEVSLRKGVMKICCKFTGEHPCRNVISIKLQSSFIEIALRHGCSPVNLLHIFRTPFPRNTSGWLLLIPVQILKENVNFSRYMSIFYNNVITTSKFPFFLNEWPMQLLFSNAQCNSYFLEVKTKRKILDQSAFY